MADRFLGATLIFLFGCMGAFAQTSVNSTKKSEVANPREYAPIQLKGSKLKDARKPCKSSLEECGNERLILLGFEGLGGTTPDYPRNETFIFKSKKGTIGVFLLTMRGYEDDSVDGERIRISFIKNGNSWNFVNAGKQNYCTRGTKGWTKKLCI